VFVVSKMCRLHIDKIVIWLHLFNLLHWGSNLCVHSFLNPWSGTTMRLQQMWTIEDTFKNSICFLLHLATFDFIDGLLNVNAWKIRCHNVKKLKCKSTCHIHVFFFVVSFIPCLLINFILSLCVGVSKFQGCCVY